MVKGRTIDGISWGDFWGGHGKDLPDLKIIWHYEKLEFNDWKGATNAVSMSRLSIATSIPTTTAQQLTKARISSSGS